jgi:outer membrane protein assembly factor BamD (BamD/ComL family)
MGRKSARAGKHFYFCLALLILSGCSLLSDWREQRQSRELMLQGHSLFSYGDYEGASNKYREAMIIAHPHVPADAATYNIGLIYAHPNNSQRNNLKAIESFSKVISDYPESPWVEEAKIWVGVLQQTERSAQEAQITREAIEQSQQAVERSRQDAEKFRLAAEKSKQEVDRTRQEMEKSRQLLERANQIDIEIEQKKRDRGK